MKLNFARIDELLLDKCWSITELSKRASLSATTLFKLKNGTNNTPSRLTVAKLAKALGVMPKEILLPKLGRDENGREGKEQQKQATTL